MHRTRTVDHRAVQHDLRQGHGPATTAHLHVYRYYMAMGTQQRRLSIVESIAQCPSPFSIEQTLKDVELALVPAKIWPKIRRAAAARLAELRGEIYVEGA